MTEGEPRPLFARPSRPISSLPSDAEPIPPPMDALSPYEVQQFQIQISGIKAQRFGGRMNRIGVSDFRRLAAFAPEVCLGLLIALLTIPPAGAQSTGSIVGRVTDVSGGVVVGAKIVVTSVETGLKRTTITTSALYFSAPA